MKRILTLQNQIAEFALGRKHSLCCRAGIESNRDQGLPKPDGSSPVSEKR